MTRNKVRHGGGYECYHSSLLISSYLGLATMFQYPTLILGFQRRHRSMSTQLMSEVRGVRPMMSIVTWRRWGSHRIPQYWGRGLGASRLMKISA